MEKLNFLPKWYLTKKEKKRNRFFIGSLLIIVCLVVFQFGIFFHNKEVLREIKSSIVEEQETNLKKKENNVFNFEKLKEFSNIYIFINSKAKVESLEINKNILDIRAEVNNLKDYLSLLDYIENSNKYKILEINKISKKESSFYFNIKLEVIY
ncbi:hypothetical protein ACER0A_007510 [Haloimpatiens sp. FM7315]|uniref:hypothetical protein n=1 Tax=Haloimpatiens sp. FM7315 TaxID=3298609 RepID=UPI00370AA3BA